MKIFIKLFNMIRIAMVFKSVTLRLNYLDSCKLRAC